jgi:hypothetical protein
VQFGLNGRYRPTTGRRALLLYSELDLRRRHQGNHHLNAFQRLDPYRVTSRCPDRFQAKIEGRLPSSNRLDRREDPFLVINIPIGPFEGF